MKTLTPFSLFRILVTCFIFTVIIHPGLWKAVARGYQGDHLFNLSGPQITGLVLITSGLALILFLTSTVSSYVVSNWMNKYAPRWIVILSCTALALVLCAIALAVVPQLHYLYYRSILPGLPAQWVQAGDLSIDSLRRYLLLSAEDSTSYHAQGVTVWVCVCAAALVAYENSKADTR